MVVAERELERCICLGCHQWFLFGQAEPGPRQRGTGDEDGQAGEQTSDDDLCPEAHPIEHRQGLDNEPGEHDECYADVNIAKDNEKPSEPVPPATPPSAAPQVAAAQATPPPRPTLPPQRPTLPPQPATPRPTEERRSDESQPAPSATPEPTAAPSETPTPPALATPTILPTPLTALPRSGQPRSSILELWMLLALALLSLGGLLAWRGSQHTRDSPSR